MALLGLLAVAEAAAQMPYETSEPRMTPKKREVYYYGMRSYPFGKIPQNARLDALLQARLKIPAFGASPRSLQALNTWKQIGPDKVGGRVRSVVTHPTDNRTLWIGAADGGIWKSTDRGETWRPLMDDANAIAMGALAVDPGDTSTLYAGTGEMSSNVDAYNGAGIMKSVDGGATWRPIGLTTVGAFSRIVIPPLDRNRVFAGATKNNGGFYRSIDGGNTWSRTFTTPVSDVTIDPRDPDRLWIGTLGRGIFRSTDGGLTFTEANNGINGEEHALERISVQAAPSDPSILYALSYETDPDADYTRIYKSTDGGASWITVYDGADFFGFQGWYNNVISVSPRDPKIVVAGGLDLLRSTDGGDHWTRLRGFNTGVHDDQHAMAFDPVDPNHLYLGNDGGMYRSDDGGASWVRISSGLAITQFYAMAINQSDPALTYGGSQDNGTVSNLSTNFGEIQHGDGFFVAVDPQEPTTLYAEDADGSFITRYEAGLSTIIMNGIDAENDEAAWSAPLVIDPLRPSILWHGRGRIYKSTNRGDLWTAVSEPFTGQCTALGVSPLNSDVVYAGSNRGELKVTTDGGAHWTDRTDAPGTVNRAITDFALSPTDPAVAYMAVSGFYTNHVFKTTDGGATWADIGRGLPDIPVNALAIHPDDEKIIYAGTDIGMFITIDGGATWASYNQGLPRVVVADLEVHRASRTLRLASHGRSMWEIPLEKPSLPPSITSPAGGEVWMGGTSHVISWSGFDDPAGVKLEYSLDGIVWRDLGRNLAGSSFLWRVDDTASATARVRVTAMGSPAITATSRLFTITRYAVGGTLDAGNIAGSPYGLAYDGEYLWAGDFGSNLLRKLDPATFRLIDTVRMRIDGADSLFTDMAYVPERGHFYIHRINSSTGSSPGGWLYEVDREGKEIGRWPSPCDYPVGLAWVHMPGGAAYLLATDRDGDENIFLLDTANPEFPAEVIPRVRPVEFGPRGATHAPGAGMFYQAITIFGNGDLRSAHAEKMTADSQQTLACTIALASPLPGSGYINARGIELDPADSTLWVSDFSGNIFRIASCDSKGPGSPPGGVESPQAPPGAALAPNVPNPFSLATTVGFSLASPAHIRLLLHDPAGHLVATFADGRFDAGTHELRFEPSGLASGVYTCSLLFDNGAMLTRAMVYVR
jgi:photosystem II stability/assembly factor-like uncharacterized protein